MKYLPHIRRWQPPQQQTKQSVMIQQYNEVQYNVYTIVRHIFTKCSIYLINIIENQLNMFKIYFKY